VAAGQEPSRDIVELVRIAGGWRIELPVGRRRRVT
jgi:hypothetical protein